MAPPTRRAFMLRRRAKVAMTSAKRRVRELAKGRTANTGTVVASSAVAAAFERRADRARVLAREAVAAREPLRFAAGLYRVQGRLAATLEVLHGRRALALTGPQASEASVSSLLGVWCSINNPPAYSVESSSSRSPVSKPPEEVVYATG